METYIKDAQAGEIENGLDFLVPVELLVPRDKNDLACVFSFTNNLLEICEARNNNAELQAGSQSESERLF